MSVMKSLWASIQGDPVFMRRVNGWLTVFWILMIPFSIATGWISSVTYVACLSLWALVSGHWSAWQAARVEVQQAQIRVVFAFVTAPCGAHEFRGLRRAAADLQHVLVRVAHRR